MQEEVYSGKGGCIQDTNFETGNRYGIDHISYTISDFTGENGNTIPTDVITFTGKDGTDLPVYLPAAEELQ